MKDKPKSGMSMKKHIKKEKHTDEKEDMKMLKKKVIKDCLK